MKPLVKLISLCTLSWDREGCVELLLEELEEPGGYRVTDCRTGEEVPFQLHTKGLQPEYYLTVMLKCVPAFGFKLFRVEKLDKGTGHMNPENFSDIIENSRFILKVDRKTGGLGSLYDRKLGRELADKRSEYTLNQYLYTSEGKPFSPEDMKLVSYKSANVTKSIIVEGETLRTIIRTTYTVYEDMDYIDVENYIQKQPSSELQTFHFVFPFDVPDREYHYDGTAAILKPGLAENGGNQIRGAAMGTYC